MFESTRQRKNLADEDAPPTNSVNDIPNEMGFTSSSHFHTSSRNSADDVPLFARRTPRPMASPTQQPAQQAIYIIVFGYPPEKYSSAVEFFQSLGASTDPEPNPEIQNCFCIGFSDAGDALRAVRKNGEILGGSWMVGVKWADQGQADAVLGQIQTAPTSIPLPESSSSNAMAVDEPSPTTVQKNTPSSLKGGIFNTPTKLAPASAAFRKNNPSSVATPTRGWGVANPVFSAQPQPQPQQQQQQSLEAPRTSSPNKGMLGQVSDLIFGW
ncbi:hypothetical protein H0H92_011710 [Tricholoma furcatifolium]|nr:hypothetical protein H0H92_011710 [Tricholoma furcatifolium]